jgi:hypothetical protein
VKFPDSIFLFLVASDANSLSRLDARHISRKAPALLIAFMQKLKPVGGRGGASGHRVAVVNREVNANSDACPNGCDTHNHAGYLSIAGANVETSRMWMGVQSISLLRRCYEKGTYRDPAEDSTNNCRQIEPQFVLASNEIALWIA